MSRSREVPQRSLEGSSSAVTNSRIRVRPTRRYGTLSPLRYPGGKAALAGFFGDIIHAMQITHPRYIEPYAGGVGAGVALLRHGIVDHLVVNDIDPAVHAFWRSVVEENTKLVELVRSTPVTIDEWQKQRDIYRTRDESDLLRLGFAFFFLNRTNRSGILNAGVIGGQHQEGTYKIDARYNRENLIERLTQIGELAERITVTDRDGRSVIQHYAQDEHAFMYIDPPYVQAGSRLYLNAFDGRDHIALAAMVNDAKEAHWLMTYDTAPVIENLYRDQFQCRLELTYSAEHPGQAEELLIASQSVANTITTLPGHSLQGEATA
ncbi:MAG: DNA methyltransferase [Candidatus Lumbricidophila eiseniae]|uniref:site-specific DNA-methyltransferase (adenine-specific) n=1 Tax=Candidatus Lumbricidiphila eiseniae TaxID=1969409 RepID=A0A2A6FV56_9MICO|nr:MAG: DNA methyltransferase [Candidatus Lumbricidophila eiseniae]